MFSFSILDGSDQEEDTSNNYSQIRLALHSGQYKIWTADYGLRTGYKKQTRYKTRSGKHGLGIKRGQRTGYKITDYGLP